MIEVVVDGGDRCGEGPIWEAARRRLLWTDIPGDVVYELAAGSGARRAVLRGVNVSAIALARDGGLLLGGAGGLSYWSETQGVRPIMAEHEGQALAINDMIAGPGGGVYFGTVYWGAGGMERHGKLYLLDAAGVVRVADDGIELANGLGFSAEGRTLYFADSAARRIYAYDVEAAGGRLSRKRVLVQFAREEGIPDGLTVDAEGFVWCALWYGGRIVRIDPDGAVERSVSIAALQVSSVAFGGAGLDELYVTSAGEAWPSQLAPSGYRADAEGQGGALYRVRAGVCGKAEYLAAVGVR
jgi:D-xylonolactonase